MTDTESYLKAIADIGSAHAKFILEHGLAWEPDANTFRGWRGQIKNCFGNSCKAVLRDPSLTYVEGYASAIIPFHHAWCLRDDGTIYDPTLRLKGRAALKTHPPRAYLGVPFKWEFVCDFLTEVRTFGLLDGMHKRSIDLMIGKVPASEFLANLKEQTA